MNIACQVSTLSNYSNNNKNYKSIITDTDLNYNDAITTSV